jgi:hypothetical protein
MNLFLAREVLKVLAREIMNETALSITRPDQSRKPHLFLIKRLSSSSKVSSILFVKMVEYENVVLVQVTQNLQISPF